MPQRLTTRQADAQDRRGRMTQRRGELTNRIRKQKKSAYLAKKRNLTITTTSSTSTSTIAQVESIKALIQEYHQNYNKNNVIPPEALKSLHVGLQLVPLVVGTDENPLVVLGQEEQAMAASLLERLRSQAALPELLPLILQILVQLTAISYTPSSDYYGYTPISWSILLSRNVQWLSLLVQLIPQQHESSSAAVILGNMVGEASSEVFAALKQAGMVPALVSAINQPSAAWALTNAIRNDTTAWASNYCSNGLLSVTMLEGLLQQPAVATQAAWMIASLTSREEAVVQYLVEHASFCPTLLQCLQSPTTPDQTVPLVQALGNIASYEKYVAPLITLPSLIPVVGQLLQAPNQRELVLQAAWLAGCLLCDAGVTDHPSTIVAAPSLLPILFQELRADAQHSLEEKRELAYALWNALAQPPTISNANLSPPLDLPSLDLIRPSLSTLVGLISSVDSDAIVAAVNVVDLLLRSIEDLVSLLETALEEEEISQALEAVCDSAMEDAAEVAANLLDDYFYDDDEAEEEVPTVGFALPRSGMGRGRGTVLPSWMPKN